MRTTSGPAIEIEWETGYAAGESTDLPKNVLIELARALGKLAACHDLAVLARDVAGSPSDGGHDRATLVAQIDSATP